MAGIIVVTKQATMSTINATTAEREAGEIKVSFSQPNPGKLTFAELGLTEDQLKTKGGFVRLVFDFSSVGEHNYYQVPTVEISYDAEVGETHWQCDFNETTILDKLDHHGHSTVLLLNRKTMAAAEHHHINQPVVHGEFPQEVTIKANESYVCFFR